MTSHTGRLYALALAIVVFFLAWAVVAARPWQSAAPDPRLKALTVREARLRQEAKLVQLVVQRRWAVYKTRLRQRNAQIARIRAEQKAAAAAQLASMRAAAAAPAAPAYSGSVASPSVRVVTLPPLTITRTS